MTSAGQPFGQVPAPFGAGGKAPMPLDLDDLRGEAPPQRTLTPRLVWRAVRRHWWQALAVWAVASAALMVVAYSKLKPTYDAWVNIQIEPPDRPLFSNSLTDLDMNAFKETQVRKVTFPTVIQPTLTAHPELLTLPRLAGAEDPEKAIRDALLVSIVPKTNLIAVGMYSEDPNEAVAIVNAVTDQYIKVVNADSSEEAVKRAGDLEQALASRERDVQDKQRELERLVKEYGSSVTEAVQDRNSATVEAYAQLSARLLELGIRREAAEQSLALLRVERPAGLGGGPSPELINQMVADAFNADPTVRRLRAELAQDEQDLKKAQSVARNKFADPAARHHQKSYNDTKARLDQLWAEMRPTLLAQLASAPQTESEYERRVAAAEAEVASLKSQEDVLARQLDQITIKSRKDGEHNLLYQFAMSDWNTALEKRDVVRRSLDQARFEMQTSGAKVTKSYDAKATFKPASNPRFKVMALVPFAVLGLIVGMLVLLEMQSGRVTDPDDLPGKLRLQVLGVVPPLPQVTGAPALAGYSQDYRAQRRLDEFVQSLDHLRVALTSARAADGGPMRVVLITSACGSEGKTTLAAQLAERCVNAGLMTLLIDGDLRNPTLSRVLEAGGGRGLINVLRDEISAEEALTVVGGAGGFHLLPAGSPRVDPSRLLQSDRLGRVLAQARESFDIILIDAPPVLPVPDALSMGRWVDGAVLAVRHDTSRFPLVERAFRRLSGVGVPVLGAVVNGVRTPSGAGSYGTYYPAGAELADA